MKRLQLLLLSIFAPAWPVWGELAYVPKVIDPFEEPWRFSEIEGLNDEEIRSIDVGGEGSLWVGLMDEIVRYDGLEWKKFGSESGLHGPIHALKVVSEDEVYALGNETLWRWGGVAWEVLDENLTIRTESGFKEDLGGRAWFASGRRLARIERDGSLWRSSILGGAAINDFCVDRSGDFWVVFGGARSVARFSLEAGVFQEEARWATPLARRDGPRGGYERNRRKILETRDGRIWVISENGRMFPIYLEKGHEEWVEVDLEAIGGRNANYAIHETSDGVLRILGEECLHRLQDGEWFVYNNADLRLTNNRARIHETDDGTVWFLEHFVRVRKIDYGGRKWQAYRDLAFQLETADGELWFVERNGGVVRHRPETDDWVMFSNKELGISDPTYLFELQDGRLALTGGHEGVAAVSFWDGEDWDMRLYPDLGTRIIHSMGIETVEGELILAGDGVGSRLSRGPLPVLGLFDRKGEMKDHYVSGLRGIYGLKFHPDGRPMIGGGKLMYLDAGSVRSYDESSDALFDWSHDFEITGNGDAWVANWGDGIWRKKDGEWRLFSKEEGLSSEYVSDLEILENGELAALTAKGLERWDGSSWFPTALPRFEAIRGGSSLKQSRDNSLWINIGTRSWYYRNYYANEDLGEFKTLRYRADDLRPDTLAEIVSEPEKYGSSFLFRFSGRDRWTETASGDLQYSYRLDGGAWSPFSFETTRFLQNFGPGKHVIEARARDNDGNVDLTPFRIDFAVTQPFWMSSWFYAGLAFLGVIVAGLVYALMLQRVRHAGEISQLRMSFLTHISHELRSPLYLIAGPLERLEKMEGLPQVVSRSVEMALRNARRLHQLVDQLLELRKIESGTLHLNPRAGDIVAFTRLAALDFDNLAQSRSQQVEFVSSRESLWLEFDGDVYRKILDNLILNALKFSPKDTKVSLSLNLSYSKSGDGWATQFVVEDEGPGILKKHLPHIFDAYYSDRRAAAKDFGAFGIGLSLVRQLVEACGGRIEVESPLVRDGEERSGARFIVTLEKVREAKASEDGEALANTIHFPSLGGFKGSEECVLVVDDQDEVREFLSEELKDTFAVLAAGSAEEGLALSRERVPDVAICDIMMPGTDGIEFCQRLRAMPETSHVPVILQTSLPTKENREAGFDAGAIDFVAKPISVGDLKRRIRSQIDSRSRLADRVRASLLRPEDEELLDEQSVFIQKARALMSEQCGDCEFSVEEFARMMGMSRSTFYRKFQAIANISPADFIKSYRLEKATTFLLNGSSVSEAAYKAGYTEASPFYRAFKKKFGCTPSEYRKRKTEATG